MSGLAPESQPEILNASEMPETSKLLWRPAAATSRLSEFMEGLNKTCGVHLTTYDEVFKWSIHNLGNFWEEVWHFTENLLYPPSTPGDDFPALVAATEGGSRETVTWRQLRERVRQCVAAMEVVGVTKGDRVAGFVANHTNALVAMLSSASLGAIWTGVSPDTGVHAVLDRLQQITPVIFFADSAIVYNTKVYDVQGKVQDIVQELSGLKAIVLFESIVQSDIHVEQQKTPRDRTYRYKDFIELGNPEAELNFAQLQPDHPVYILYSSGTTGKPKCIVHGAIGTLIQHKKEHILQCDIRPGDRLFYFTTTTWMMWHWLVSGLASGATIVLYDGSPFRPLDAVGAGEMAMPKLIEELGITHFGTSAKYLSMLEQKRILPKETVPMHKLRAIYSTGSSLAPSTFRYVYRAFGPDINLGSITGGTDIISLFGAPSPLSPVYAGEVQVRGLGMAVEVWDHEGNNVTETGEAGDLVCVKPFPCQPVMFWGDDGDAAYRRSYFEHFPGVWHHGDFVKFNPQTGGLIMLGRSDGILKPAGVRFGSAEIYNILLKHFPDEITDALCVGRKRETDSDETVVLFVKMVEGKQLSESLQNKIRAVIKTDLSARHVPAIIDDCLQIPVTTNGKKVEIAVKQILCGLNVKVSASVANAECLEWYRQWARDHA